MENWIGAGVWAILGGVIGLLMRSIVHAPATTSGHTTLLVVLGAFGAVVGGMLGVGIFHFEHPSALSLGGFGGAVVLAAFMTYLYRWGVRGWL